MSSGAGKAGFRSRKRALTRRSRLLAGYPQKFSVLRRSKTSLIFELVATHDTCPGRPTTISDRFPKFLPFCLFVGQRYDQRSRLDAERAHREIYTAPLGKPANVSCGTAKFAASNAGGLAANQALSEI